MPECYDGEEANGRGRGFAMAKKEPRFVKSDDK
jgi:hypothetical protein